MSKRKDIAPPPPSSSGEQEVRNYYGKVKKNRRIQNTGETLRKIVAHLNFLR